MRHTLRYLAWGFLSNTAIKLYWLAPRETFQEELLLIHRKCLKKAHDARMEGEAHERVSDSAAD